MTETTTKERPIKKICEACGCTYTPKAMARAKKQRTCSYQCREILRAAPQNFWKMVRQSVGCWEWQGTKSTLGYGVVQRQGRKTGAHRIAYELTYGPIPGGLEVCHKCDNPRCVNPSHLFLGTHRENMRDMCAKGRHNKPKGEAAGRAALTETQVRSIRLQYIARKVGYGKLARQYGVGKSTIEAIITRKTWVHV